MPGGKVLVCQQCKRRFKTRAALQQHAVDAHGPSNNRSARRAAPARTVRKRGNPPAASSATLQTVSGTDVIFSVGLGKDVPVGRPLVSTLIGPSSLAGTRLHALSQNWSRWRPLRLRVEVTGGGSAMTYGSLVFGWAPDNHWAFAKSREDYQRIAALVPSTTMRVFETRSLTIPCETTRKWYNVLGTPDDACHGSLLGVVATAVGGYTSAIGLSVTLHWTVQFQGAEFTQTKVSEEDTISPDAGWENLFTTSDGSWNAERLTFKTHAGGAMVPFSAAKPNHVYTPAPGVKVYYVKEDGTSGECGFFVPIVGYTTPGLGLCATKLDAIAYVKSSDPTKLIKYKAASGYATPAVPSFNGKPAAVMEREFRVFVQSIYGKTHEEIQGLIGDILETIGEIDLERSLPLAGRSPVTSRPPRTDSEFSDFLKVDPNLPAS